MNKEDLTEEEIQLALLIYTTLKPEERIAKYKEAKLEAIKKGIL